MELNCVELDRERTVDKIAGRALTIGRTALAPAKLDHSPQRGTCQFQKSL